MKNAVIYIYVTVNMRNQSNSIGQSVFKLESGNEHVDGQMDVGHINLIGGLVTRNQPKNMPYIPQNVSKMMHGG